QHDHCGSDPGEDGEADAKGRSRQKQYSGPERQEPEQGQRDAEETADHRSTSQSRPKRQARRGRMPALRGDRSTSTAQRDPAPAATSRGAITNATQRIQPVSTKIRRASSAPRGRKDMLWAPG